VPFRFPTCFACGNDKVGVYFKELKYYDQIKHHYAFLKHITRRTDTEFA